MFCNVSITRKISTIFVCHLDVQKGDVGNLTCEVMQVKKNGRNELLEKKSVEIKMRGNGNDLCMVSQMSQYINNNLE